MKLHYFLFAVVTLTLATSPVYGQQSPQTVIRDAGGRTIGTATTDSGGQTTFRDSGGRTTGTASHDSQGTTTFRNDRGVTTGTTQSFERR
jgi:hypothetical protein